jgi:hypothetical protein
VGGKKRSDNEVREHPSEDPHEGEDRRVHIKSVVKNTSIKSAPSTITIVDAIQMSATVPTLSSGGEVMPIVLCNQSKTALTRFVDTIPLPTIAQRTNITT